MRKPGDKCKTPGRSTIIRVVVGRIGLRSLETEVDRRDAILKYTTKEQRGIEIGPWFNPIASKREGYRCLVLDVFDSGNAQKAGR
jgi:hypothetical protein